ncbi:MAG: hypothetical protein E7005_00250 [Alphaproteobacteria bacterium]|nr:hypothetical protein [Alphaproteobacteria bacterium]
MKPENKTTDNLVKCSEKSNNISTVRQEIIKINCDFMRAGTPNFSNNDALERFAAITAATNNSPTMIAAMMSTEAILLRNGTINTSLVHIASIVYENALRNPNCDRDVFDVARDSVSNILNNTPESSLLSVQSSLSNTQNLIEQLSPNYNDRDQAYFNSIPPNSSNLFQTKYGVANPGAEEIPGHVLFQTQEGYQEGYRIAPKNRISKYLDKDGNFNEKTTSETIELTPNKQDKNNSKDMGIVAKGNSLGD